MSQVETNVTKAADALKMEGTRGTVIPYTETVLNPTKFQGIKLPDSGSISTAVATVVNNFQFFISAGSTGVGVGGICVGFNYDSPSGQNMASLIPNGVAGGASYTYAFGMTNGIGPLGPTTYDLPFTGTPQTIFSNGFLGPTDYFPTNVSSIRIVSMEMEVTCLGSNFANQGEIVFGYLAPYIMDAQFVSNAQIDPTTLKSLPGIRYAPLAQNKCWSARYLPLDPSSAIFYNMDNIANDVTNFLRDRGCFICIVTGGQATTTSFDVKITANLEFVPRSNSVSFAAGTPNDYDPIGYALALNKLRSSDTTMIKNTMSSVTSTPLSGSNAVARAQHVAYLDKNYPKGRFSHPTIYLIPTIHSGPVSIGPAGLATSLAPALASIGSNLTDKLVDLVMGFFGKGKPQKQKNKNKNKKKITGDWNKDQMLVQEKFVFGGKSKGKKKKKSSSANKKK